VIGRSRIVLADDHPIVLAGLRNLIQPEADLEIVGEASNGLAALKVIRERQPDIAVVDLSMPELNGILLSRRLAVEMPSVRVLALTLHEDRAFLKQAIDAGVRGYVLKRSAAESLVHAIRAVLACGLYVDPAIANSLFDVNPKRVSQHRSDAITLELTDRETKVLKCVALGFTNKEIANQLSVGVKSIETYKARGLHKLGFKSRVQLVRYASTQGWLAEVSV
jgi:DNA-binding NarL/FixJ family response regulator